MTDLGPTLLNWMSRLLKNESVLYPSTCTFRSRLRVKICSTGHEALFQTLLTELMTTSLVLRGTGR